MYRAIIVGVSCLIAGFIQGVAGFGCGMVMMLFFPLCFGFVEAVSLAGTISIAVHAALLFIFRNSVDIKRMLLPTLLYTAVCVIAIELVEFLDIGILELMFGFFLIALALFFFFFSEKVKIKDTLVSGALCSAISGSFAGLFSIGGPLVSIYYSSVFSDHDIYIGSTQFMFLVSAVIATASRIVNGLYPLSLVPYAIEGTVCILIAAFIGSTVSKKLKIEHLRKIIYGCVGLTGLVAVIQNINAM